ncbi:hypothetical protein [Phocaeicola abscessus]|uniref:hypothetical protein n=1 Tax=Phocaeicola abscessus TaxID=555313 RepID=UPI00056A0865|nr:hypothetical protein [Phocaeicola abscessus]
MEKTKEKTAIIAKKQTYTKPTMEVYTLELESSVLQSSVDDFRDGGGWESSIATPFGGNDEHIISTKA